MRRPGQLIEDPCPTCGGSGLTRQTKRYKVNIPAGVKDGTRIRLAGKGEAGPRGGPPGDLYVTTRVAPSPVFKQLDGGNLEVTVPITVAEALRGATIEVPTLDGTKKIKVRAGHQHGTVQRLRGEGPPSPGQGQAATSATGSRSTSRRKLTDEQREAVEKLAEAMNGSDPRAELLRKAAARISDGTAARRGAGTITIDDRRGAWRLHDLGRRRARRDAPADPADVRGARPDHAASARRRTRASTRRATSSGCAGSSR